MLGAEIKRMDASLDPETLRRHRLGHLLQSLVLIAGLALLLAACPGSPWPRSWAPFPWRSADASRPA